MSHPPAMRQSRFARCMHVLAWIALLLMICPVYAMPAEDAGHPVNAMQVHHEMVPAGRHAQSQPPVHHHDGDDCCGQTGQGIHHCDAMCGSAWLPSVPFVAGAFTRASMLYAALPTRETPVRHPVPPLRPPSV